jgi:hypothetical protein
MNPIAAVPGPEIGKNNFRSIVSLIRNPGRGGFIIRAW